VTPKAPLDLEGARVVATLVRRERRPLWISLAIGSAAIAIAAGWLGAAARATALDEGKDAAVAAVRSVVSPILAREDLSRPIGDHHGLRLEADVAHALSGATAFESVRVFGPDARMLLDGPARGRTIDEIAPFVADAAEGRTTGTIAHGVFAAYVPHRVAGELRVVEITAVPGAFAPARSWDLAVAGAGALAVGSLAMSAIAARAGATPSNGGSLYQPAMPRRPQTTAATAPAAPTGSVFAVDGRSELEIRLRESHARASEAEDSFRSVQTQLKDALGHLRDLEGRLTVEQTHKATAQRELETLRTQIRETSERLHAAEIENESLRERMTLRHRELEELRRTIATSAPGDTEIAELRLRLETAENAAAALARELDRVETELERTRSRFHMAMLTEALREFDNDAIEIEDEDALDHPVVIRNGSSVTTPATRR
jgi:hypothetical protein